MKGSEEFEYCGIATYMASPYVSLDESKRYDIAVVGVPIDFGSSYRLGAKYAPKAIREHSFMDRIAVGRYYDFDSEQWINGNGLSICDVGDVDIYPTNPEKTIAETIKAVSAIRKNSFPVILGGDHSITYANFKACASVLADRGKKIGILHFDAHLDIEEEYLPALPEIWHGNAFRKLIEEGLLDSKRMVTVGPRGRIGEGLYRYAKEKGIHIFSAEQVKKDGVENTMEKVIRIFSQDMDYVFLSIDIDCMDISQAPGAGTPKYGGLSAGELIRALLLMKELPIIGLDLVEVNPKFDPSGTTAIIAQELLYNFLSFGLNKDVQPKI